MSYHLSGFQKLYRKGSKMVSFLVCLVVPYRPHPHCHFFKWNENRFNLLGTLVFKYSMNCVCDAAVIWDSYCSLPPLDVPYDYESPCFQVFPSPFSCPLSTYQPCSVSQTEKLNQRLINQVADESGTEPGSPATKWGSGTLQCP